MKFVRCTPNGGKNIVYVNLKDVKYIFREEMLGRPTVIETFNGEIYDCWYELNGNSKLKDCIVKF
jgi:hypothetical protein